MSSRTLTEEIVTLRRRLEEALEENRWLKEKLNPPSPDRPKLGLSMQQWRVFNVIVSHYPGAAPKSAIRGVFSDHVSDYDRITLTLIYNIRNTLKPHGVFIENVRGYGYALSADSKAKLDELLAEESA